MTPNTQTKDYMYYSYICNIIMWIKIFNLILSESYAKIYIKIHYIHEQL